MNETHRRSQHVYNISHTTYHVNIFLENFLNYFPDLEFELV